MVPIFVDLSRDRGFHGINIIFKTRLESFKYWPRTQGVQATNQGAIDTQFGKCIEFSRNYQMTYPDCACLKHSRPGLALVRIESHEVVYSIALIDHSPDKE